MSFIDALESMAKGVVGGVALITILPICGPVGAITATGVALGSALGAAAGLADELKKDGDAHA